MRGRGNWGGIDGARRDGGVGRFVGSGEERLGGDLEFEAKVVHHHEGVLSERERM